MPKEREDLLVRLLARAMLTLQFEQAESAIWASQLAMLGFLNTNRAGAARSYLHDTYYAPAAKAYSDWFKNHSFDHYMGFVVRNALVENTDQQFQITQQDIEYLAWRA
jgi:1,2-phenylacetyl-CoA epoxidase catalytic subunit